MHALVTEVPTTIDRLRTRGGLRVITCVLVLVSLAAWYVVLSRGGWTYDDNLYFGLARTQPLGSFVNADLFGHWAVGYKLVFWAIEHGMPIDYRWVLLGVLLLLGITAFLFGRVVEMLVGGWWVPLFAAVYFTLCVLLIRSLEWFSSGLQAVPTLACDIICLWAYLHYQRQPAARWAFISAGAILVGLLFYEKALLMPVFILALRVLVQTESLRPRSVARAIWRERAIWAAYLLVVAAYLLTREVDAAGSVGSTGLPTVWQWLEMYWLMWSKALVPAAFGFSLPTPAYNSWQLAVGIVLELVVAGAIVISVRRGASAWRAWAALAFCIFVLGIVVAVGRIQVLGLGAATDPRYLVEGAWLIPLFVCLAFVGPQTRRSADTAVARGDGMRAPRRLAVALVLACAGYASASIAAAANWEDSWPGVAARGWETKVEAGLATLSARRDHPVIADAAAPDIILQSSFAPFNFLSFVLPHYGPALAVDGPLVGPLYVVSASGRIKRAGFVPAAATRTIAHCGRAGAGLKLEEELASPPAIAGGPYYAVVSYRTAEPARVAVFVDTGSGFPGAPNSLLVFSPDAHRSIVWLGYGSPHRILLSSPTGPYACLSGISVVSLVPAH